MAKRKVLDVVRTFVAACVDILTHASAVAAIVRSEKDSIAGMLRDALFALCDSFLKSGTFDAAGYLGACEDAFGNGLRHTAKDYKGGMLRERLTDAKVELDTIKVYMAQVRAVALWLADKDNHAKRVHPNGEALSLGALYKLAKMAKKPTVATSDKAPTEGEAPAEAPAEASMEQWIAAHGIGAVLHTCAEMLRVERKTKTDAAALDAIAARMQA